LGPPLLTVVLCMVPRRPRSTLFPYTTLFRSVLPEIRRIVAVDARVEIVDAGLVIDPSAGGRRDPDLLRKLLVPKLLTAVIDIERSEEHTSELQSRENLVCRLLLEKKKYSLVQ